MNERPCIQSGPVGTCGESIPRWARSFDKSGYHADYEQCQHPWSDFVGQTKAPRPVEAGASFVRSAPKVDVLAVLKDSRTTVCDPEAATFYAPITAKLAGAAAELTRRATLVDGVEVIAPVHSVTRTSGAGAASFACVPRGRRYSPPPRGGEESRQQDALRSYIVSDG